MIVRRIITLISLFLAILIPLTACKQDKVTKSETEQLEDLFLGSWRLDIPSNSSIDKKVSKTIIYNFRDAHLLVVTLISNSDSQKQEYFIPISYNYRAHLNNKKDTYEEIEVGSWRILKNKSLIISHLNTDTGKLNIKTAELLSYDKNNITLKETTYIEEPNDTGITKRVPKTYCIQLTRIF